MNVAELSRAQVSARLVRFGRPVIWPLALSLLFRLVSATLGIALLVVAVRGVAGVATGHAAIGRTVVTLVALALVKGLARYLEQFCGHWVAFSSLAMMRVDLYRRLVPQSPAGILSRRSGDLLARATKDVDRVEVFFAHTLVPAVAAVLVPLGVLVALAVRDPLLAVVLVPFLVLAGVVVPRWRQRAASDASATVRVQRGAVSQLATEARQGLRELLAFDAADRHRARVADAGGRVATGLGVLGRVTARRRGVNATLVPLALSVVALVGAARVGAGALGWTDWLVALALAAAAFDALLAVEDVAPDLEQAFAASRRIWAVTDTPPATTSPEHPRALPDPPWEIRFEDVRFAYPGTTAPVLDGLDLTLPAGSVTGVVGASGAGKTTLVHLLTRAWDPQAGRVLLGGVDVRELDLAELRRHVAVVSQSTYLFNDTIAGNLRLARPDATDDELVAACRRARLHDAIQGLPQGYRTRVGEHGERLSGGQRQRLAIARALLLDAPVLVLDEATSQLDVATEAEVTDALAEAVRGRTVLQIAHRPEALGTADRIVTLPPPRGS